MTILHTSDWHLGATLKDHPRDHEHDRFLEWLTQRIVTLAADAVIITGDVFDTANPSGKALDRWYGWLAQVLRLSPEVAIVVVGGNHDGAVRLDAPDPLLRRLRVHTVGGLPRTELGVIDLDRVLIPLDGADGQRVWVGAVPYLHPSDLTDGDVGTVYAAVREALVARAGPNDGLILTGHLTTQGGAPSESERDIVGGLAGVDVGVFGEECQYVALGHLHRPQAAGGTASYAGSPIPISFAEREYVHRIVRLEVTRHPEGRPVVIQHNLPIDRSVSVELWPETGPALTVAEALARIDAAGALRKNEQPPLVAIRLVPGTNAADRRDIHDKARERHVRVLHVESAAALQGMQAPAGRVQADEMTPLGLLEQEWARKCGEPLPTTLRELFLGLIAEIDAGDAA